MSHTLPQYTAVTAEWAAKNGVKNVYTLVADFGPGHDAENQFRKSFTAAGGEVAHGPAQYAQERAASLSELVELGGIEPPTLRLPA